jgi:hypothetical protein
MLTVLYQLPTFCGVVAERNFLVQEVKHNRWCGGAGGGGGKGGVVELVMMTVVVVIFTVEVWYIAPSDHDYDHDGGGKIIFCLPIKFH